MLTLESGAAGAQHNTAGSRTCTYSPTARVMYVTGAGAGVSAGIVMSLLMMLAGMLRGQGPWQMPDLIAAMWMGNTVATGTLSLATLVGFATHVVTSALMGVVAVPFVAGLPRWRVLIISIAYAIASYPFVFALVLSWANPLMVARTSMLDMVPAHAVFGIVFGVIFPWLADRIVSALGRATSA